jgi:Zn-dependent M28 family amino/carboxypeptidase
VIPKEALPVTLAADEERKVPVIHVGSAVIECLFGSMDSLRELQADIDRTLQPGSLAIPGVRLRVKTTTEITRMQASNVASSLEGSDSVHEVVVIGAHYDHVGVSRDHKPGDDFIYNGADDNASGTTALLGIARAMSAMPLHPRRTVLFLAFAGEEKGLFGSEYYVRNPLLPLQKTVAMLNFDMVGRNGRDSLYIIGAKESPDLARIVHEANRDVGMVLIDSELEGGGSDHMSFTAKGIPAVHFFSGLHADYHRVSDNPDRIDMQKVSLVAQLGLLTAWTIANETEQYILVPKQPTTH